MRMRSYAQFVRKFVWPKYYCGFRTLYKGLHDHSVCRGSCDIGKFPDAIFDGSTLTYFEEQVYKNRTLNELGKARDVGFSVEEHWEFFGKVIIKPDFENGSFEEIYAAYEKACKR